MRALWLDLACVQALDNARVGARQWRLASTATLDLDRLHIPIGKCWLNLDRYGNTSSASLPISLDEAHRAGRLRPGDLVAMMAIGAGMTWGSALMRW